MPIQPADSAFSFHADSYLPVLSRADNRAACQASFTFFDAVQETAALSVLSGLTFEKFLAEGVSFVVDLYKETSLEGKAKLFAVKSAKIRSGVENTRTERDYDLYCVLLEIQLLCHPPLWGHSSIISVLGYDWRKGPKLTPFPVIVVEYAEHGELSQYLQSSGFKTNEQKALFCLDISKGLHMLHACKIAHGDVKLPNILVARGEDGKPVAKISDFGHATTGFEATQRSHYSGTRFYIPPETAQAKGLTFDDLYRCDVFTYGLAVWEILNDGLPYFVDSGDSTASPVPDKQPCQSEMGRLSGIILDRVFGAAEKDRAFYQDILGNTTMQTSISRYDMGKVVDLFSTHYKQAGTAAENIATAFPFQRTSMGIWNFAPTESVIPRVAQQQAFLDLKNTYDNGDSEYPGRLLLLLSFCCAHGYGVSVSLVEALKYWRRAAQTGLLSVNSLLSRIEDAIRSYSLNDISVAYEPSLYVERGDFLDHLEQQICGSSLNNYAARIHCWENCWLQVCRVAPFEIIDEKGVSQAYTVMDLRAGGCDEFSGANLTAMTVRAKTEYGTTEAPLLPHVAFMGWVDILDLLLKCTGSDVLDYYYNSPTWFGTLLSAAASTGQGHVIRYLLEKGANARCNPDADIVFKQSWSPFHYFFLLSEDYNADDIASLLLEHGADPNSMIESPSSINPIIGIEFPIDIAGTPLDTAVRVGDIRTARALLRCGGDPLLHCPAIRSMDTHTPLQLAVALHEFDIVELFLGHLQEFNRLSNVRGQSLESPLHHISGSICGDNRSLSKPSNSHQRYR